jgi:tripartite-type tricarboxylate transporter receptor subunit TctC
MKQFIVSLVAVLALASLVLTGCSQAAPAAPTQAPSSSSKAAEPTKAAAPAAEPTKAAAPAAQPTAAAAPAKKIDWPEKNKTISLIIGYAAGGGADIAARIMGPALEKELGVPVQVVNRAGAGSQVAVASVQSAKPDGYTIGYANWPNIITVYQDPERKATFTRKDFLPIALHVADPMAIAVKSDSPYKTMKDLVEAAKAKPDQIKVGHSGLLSNEHLAYLKLQKEFGASFNIVAFDGAAPEVTAVLGGHIDAAGGGFGSMLPHAKSGTMRIIATFAPEGKQMGINGVTTMEEQGLKGYYALTRGWFVPKDTPKEVVDVLSAAFKKVILTDEQKAKILESGQVTQYMDPAQMAAYWEKMDTDVEPLMKMAKESEKK